MSRDRLHDPGADAAHTQLWRHDHVKDASNGGEVTDHTLQTNEPVGGSIDGRHDNTAASQHEDDVVGRAITGPPLRAKKPHEVRKALRQDDRLQRHIPGVSNWLHP